jgi:hypothetical protein
MRLIWQVAETFASVKETIHSVKAWLAENGTSEDRISLSKGSMWMKVDSTFDESEVLLKTKYKVRGSPLLHSRS